MGETESDRTMWCGNLNEKITESALYELFLQAGPLDKIRLVTDRDTKKPKYAFVVFKHAISVPYTIDLMNGLRMYGQNLKLQTRGGSSINTLRQQYTQQAASQSWAGGAHQQQQGQFNRSYSEPSLAPEQQMRGGSRGMFPSPQHTPQASMHRSDTYHGQNMQDSGHHTPDRRGNRSDSHLQPRDRSRSRDGSNRDHDDRDNRGGHDRDRDRNRDHSQNRGRDQRNVNHDRGRQHSGSGRDRDMRPQERRSRDQDLRPPVPSLNTQQAQLIQFQVAQVAQAAQMRMQMNQQSLRGQLPPWQQKGAWKRF